MSNLRLNIFKMTFGILTLFVYSVPNADIYINMSQDSQQEITIPASQSVIVHHLNPGDAMRECRIEGSVEISTFSGQEHFPLESESATLTTIRFNNSVTPSMRLSSSLMNHAADDVKI